MPLADGATFAGCTIVRLQGDIPSPTVTTEATDTPLPNRRRVANTSLHATDWDDPAAVLGSDPAQ